MSNDLARSGESVELAPRTVRIDGIDVMPEHIEQLLVADARRVVFDLQRLVVAGASRRHLLVGRIGRLAARVAGDCRHHARHLLERLLDAPEAPAREDGGLGLCRPPLRVSNADRSENGERGEPTPEPQERAHDEMPSRVAAGQDEDFFSGMNFKATPFMQ